MGTPTCASRRVSTTGALCCEDSSTRTAERRFGDLDKGGIGVCLRGGDADLLGLRSRLSLPCFLFLLCLRSFFSRFSRFFLSFFAFLAFFAGLSVALDDSSWALLSERRCLECAGLAERRRLLTLRLRWRSRSRSRSRSWLRLRLRRCFRYFFGLLLRGRLTGWSSRCVIVALSS